MSLFLVLAAFGGGILGAVIGGLPVFIFAGFMVLAGLTAGPDSVDFIGGIAFGPFLSPHIAFAGGAAAAAFAHRKGILDNGGNILEPLIKFNDPVVLLVGGVFGVVGLLTEYFFSAVLGLPLDTIALTVVATGVMCRFIFGRTGLMGHCKEETRVYFPVKESLGTLIVMGIGLGLLASYFAIEYNLILIGFGLGVPFLIFAQMGFPVPATHHIFVVSALAASASGNMMIGVLFAILASVIADVISKVFNSYCDSHIDPPASAIAIGSLLVSLIF